MSIPDSIYEQMAKRIEMLEAELQEAKQDSKDAERYRWMCESEENFKDVYFEARFTKSNESNIGNVRIIIDELMAKAKK